MYLYKWFKLKKNICIPESFNINIYYQFSTKTFVNSPTSTHKFKRLVCTQIRLKFDMTKTINTHLSKNSKHKFLTLNQYYCIQQTKSESKIYFI